MGKKKDNRKREDKLVTNRLDYINAWEDLQEPKMSWETFKRMLPVFDGSEFLLKGNEWRTKHDTLAPLGKPL